MSEQITGSLKTPPFASYDLVVYFGGGLFSVPFLNRYIFEPFNLTWPSYKITFSSPIASETVSILTSLFSIYVIGHILAYASSQIIEKPVDRFLGKISTALIFATEWTSRNRNESIRALIYDRAKRIKSDAAILATLVRAVVHIPALPIYLAIYTFGVFSYYETRLTKPVLDAARLKLQTIGLGQIDLTIRSKWYKPLEYFVINRYPAAVPRMYNYLIISGIFRTISLVFLAAMWSCLYYLIHFKSDEDWLLKPLFGTSVRHIGALEFTLLSVIYAFCIFSYVKFQRRYAEEAIFAFVFSKD